MKKILVPALGLMAVVGLTFAVMARQPEPKPGEGKPQPPAGEPMRGPRGEPGQPGQPGRRGEGGGGMNLEGAMKTMNRNAKALRAVIGDAAKKDEAFKLVGEMQRACVQSKMSPLPQSVLGGAKDDAERDALKAKFRTNLLDVLRKLISCEQNLIDGKPDVAKADVDAILEMKDKGHHDMGMKE